jgi:hypothetical protein
MAGLALKGLCATPGIVAFQYYPSTTLELCMGHFGRQGDEVSSC